MDLFCLNQGWTQWGPKGARAPRAQKKILVAKIFKKKKKKDLGPLSQPASLVKTQEPILDNKFLILSDSLSLNFLTLCLVTVLAVISLL